MFGLFGNTATDPVCKMKVDKASLSLRDKKTQYFSDYQGGKYYFCSENCLQTFTKAPEQYFVQSAKCCH